jgi:phage gpG-like protein
MRFGIEIQSSGEAELIRGFNQIEEVVRDMRPVWKDVKPVLFDIEKKLFDSEGGTGKSGKWKSLSKSYSEIKQKAFGNKKILEASGKLRKSLTSDTSDTIFEGNQTDLEFGSKLPQFRGHMKGYAAKNLPVRKPVDISDQARERIGRTVRKSLLSRIK